MTKKICVSLLVLLMAVCFVISIVGCTNNTTSNTSQSSKTDSMSKNSQTEDPSQSSKTDEEDTGIAELFDLVDNGTGYTVNGFKRDIDISSVKKLVIPSSYKGKPVTKIGGSAFYGCKRLTHVTIGNNITYIGDYAFDDCDNLQYNEYDNVYYLGNNTNPYLLLVRPKDTSVTSLSIANTTKFIYSNAFNNCRNLTSITLPDSVTSIGSFAFFDCERLQYNDYDHAYYLGNSNNAYVALIKATNTYIKSISIANTTKLIYNNAFELCSRLTDVTIPDSVISIGDSVFTGCVNLASITVDANNVVYSSYDGILYDKEKTELIRTPQDKNGEVVIPNSVITICKEAFWGCYDIKNITIGNSVTSIDYAAFAFCEFSTIIIPNSVTRIDAYAFFSCRLTSITIPNSVTYIGSNAFGESLLRNVTFQDISGWWIAEYYTDTLIRTLPSADLSDTYIAARYLMADYSRYVWKHI